MKKGRGTLIVCRETGRAAELIRLAKEYGRSVRSLSVRELSRICQQHRGYLLQLDTAGRHTSSRLSLEEFVRNASPVSLVLVLDGISDPVNFGNILRSADQFRVDAVIIPGRRSVRLHADSLSRSSAGAVEWVKVIEVPNCSRSVEMLKKHNFWVWGTDAPGSSSKTVLRADKVDMAGRTALVLGREGNGMHTLVRERCDGIITIPTAGKIDSLNVSAVAAILLYEVNRQSGFRKLTGD